MEKKDLNWSELSFSYIDTDYRFSAVFEDGEWSEGELITSSQMSIHEGSPVLHYAQTCFEGLKAQTAPNGDILLFRPDLNCKRMASTTARLMMPSVPEALFLRGIEETVRANAAWVPPHGSGASSRRSHVAAPTPRLPARSPQCLEGTMLLEQMAS